MYVKTRTYNTKGKHNVSTRENRELSYGQQYTIAVLISIKPLVHYDKTRQISSSNENWTKIKVSSGFTHTHQFLWFLAWGRA
jgi:hypothetical protein